MIKGKILGKWVALISVILGFGGVESQLENLSNVGNIVLEQDPRDQDPFYRNFYARAEGMPLAAVNSVVHNVKHHSEGHFNLWHELPSHRVRPGYSTTTKAPKIRTTTVPWVRGRHRPQFGPQPAPWYQNDPDGYDTGQHGSDYEEEEGTPPAQRPRGRRPPGGHGRRPPAPMAPVRIQVGKEEGLVENKDSEGLALPGGDEGTKAEGSEGTMNSEDVKVTTTEKATTTTTTRAPKTTKKSEKKKEKDEEATDTDGDDEGTKKEKNDNNDEGGRHGEIDLAELKKDGAIHRLRTSGKGKTLGDEDDENEEDEEDKSKKKDKKKGKMEEDEEEDDDDKKSKSGNKKKNGKNYDKKNGKKNGKRKSKKDEDDTEYDYDDEDTEDDKNGDLKKIDGDVQIPKTVDGDTDHHEDDEEEDEEEEDERSSKWKKKVKHKKGKKNHEEEEEDDEEEEEEEYHSPQNQRSMKNSKPSCPPALQRPQNLHPHQHQPPSPHQQNIPPNQVPYPHPDAYGYTHPTMPTTIPSSTMQYSRGGMGDDYHEFERMDCTENSEDSKDNEEEDDHSDEHKERKKKKKSKKNHKKKGKKKSKKGGKKGQASLDYLTSREKIDQNKRNQGHILDELHADEDLKKIRKTAKPPESGMDCSTAVDEFPLKCGAWKTAGFCDTNQATQFLWCRKTCLCSNVSTVTSTASSSTK